MKINRSIEKEVVESRKANLRKLLERGPVTFKHFKGNYYEVLNIAKHTEEDCELVIYRTKYSKVPKIWARPLNMFLSYIEEKDVEKNTDIQYRMTFSEGIGLTEEQRKQISLYRERAKAGKQFVRSIRGDIYEIFMVTDYPQTINETVFVKDLLNRQKVIAIPASELFTENYQFVDQITYQQLLEASELSDRLALDIFEPND